MCPSDGSGLGTWYLGFGVLKVIWRNGIWIQNWTRNPGPITNMYFKKGTYFFVKINKTTIPSPLPPPPSIFLSLICRISQIENFLKSIFHFFLYFFLLWWLIVFEHTQHIWVRYILVNELYHEIHFKLKKSKPLW